MPDKLIANGFNAGAAAMQRGEVIRLTADRMFQKAQADVAANLDGLIGIQHSLGPIAQGGLVVMTSLGLERVLLEPGLVGLAGGQKLYVSATMPGRATNVAPVLPALSRPFAIIHEAAPWYDLDGTVEAFVFTAASDEASSSGSGGIPTPADKFLTPAAQGMKGAIERAVAEAADAVLAWLVAGDIEGCMTRFHSRWNQGPEP